MVDVEASLFIDTIAAVYLFRGVCFLFLVVGLRDACRSGWFSFVGIFLIRNFLRRVVICVWLYVGPFLEGCVLIGSLVFVSFEVGSYIFGYVYC